MLTQRPYKHDISSRSKSPQSITVLSHKPHKHTVVPRGRHGTTLHLPPSSTPQHHLSTIFYGTISTTNPKPPAKRNPPNHTIATDFTARQGVLLHYTYWLTLRHSGNFRDVPLIEVSVEGGSTIKHCGKDKQADYMHSQRTRTRKPEGRTLGSNNTVTAQRGPNILQMTDIHPTNPNKPPPSEPPCITRCMCSGHAPLHRPYITPSTRTFGSQKACHLIKTLNNGQTSTNSYTQSS